MLRNIAPLLSLSFLGFVIYSNSVHVPFHFDDYGWIVENSAIRLKGTAAEGIRGILLSDRPVSIASFAVNYSLGGLDATWYHIANIAIHIAASFGLFLFSNVTLSVLGLPRERAFTASLLASLLWLSNPINTQAVTYIVQRMTSLGAMFYVYSLYFYARGRLSPERRLPYFLLSLFAAIMAFGSKQNTFTLPLFLLLYELFIIRKGDLSAVRRKGFYIPAAAAAALLLAAALYLYPEVFKAIFFPYKGMLSVIKERLYTQSRVLFLYMSLFLFPAGSRFSVEYDIPLSRTLLDPAATLPAVGGVLLAAAAVLSIKKRPFYGFFLLWFLGNMAIESLNIGLAVMYDHRMYLPGMGLSVIAGKWMVDAARRERLRLLPPALLILAFSINAHLRNQVWKDPVTLWADAVKKAPYSISARSNLGLSLLGEDRMEEGIAELKTARGISPRDPNVRYHLGVAFYEHKVYDMAVDEFRAVWNMGFDSPVGRPTIDVYFLMMARSFLAHGHIEKGRQLLMEAGRFHPENVKVKDLLEKLEKGELTGDDLRPEGW